MDGKRDTDRRIRAGVDLVNFGAFADPSLVREVARTAEGSGWDGLFLWDHLAYVWGPTTADPWILLAAVAADTSRITIGTTVTPLPRRRPHEVALAAATLDELAEGRLVVGMGLGGEPREYEAFGHESQPGSRAAALDEALGVIDGLWSGAPVHHDGPRYPVDGVAMPRFRTRRIPVWIGGESPAALRRAAERDGWVGSVADPEGRPVNAVDPAGLASRVQALRAAGAGEGFDVAVIGYSDPGGGDPVADYAAAGATWWLEMLSEMRGPPDDLLARVAAGPPEAVVPATA